MATSATVPGHPAPVFERAVLLPGNWGERIAQAGFLVCESIAPQPVVSDSIFDTFRAIFARKNTVTLSMATGGEANTFIRAFYENVTMTNIVEWNASNDRGSVSDPFDYISAPIEPTYTLRAKINWLEPSKPMPIDDE